MQAPFPMQSGTKRCGFAGQRGCNRYSALPAIVLVVLALFLRAEQAHAAIDLPNANDPLGTVLDTLYAIGFVDQAVVEARPMIQCLVDGKSVDVCAEYSAGQAQGFVPNDPKIQKVVDIFHAFQAKDYLEVFLLAGEQVVCSLVPGGAVKDLFCTGIFDIAEPVITAAYEAVEEENFLELVAVLGVEYACDLLPAGELCTLLADIVNGVAEGVEDAVAALGSLAEDIAGQTQHMPVEQYYLKYWRPWLEYAVVKQLHTGQPAYLYAGKYASSSTSCAEYFDSHKMSASNADKVCGIMKNRFMEEIAETAKVFQAFPSVFFAGWAAPRIPGWAAAYYHDVDEFASTVAATQWNGLPLAQTLLSSNAPFKDLWSQCNAQKPLALPGIPGPNQGVHNADKAMMGTAISWACTRVGQLLADALQQQKVKIDGVGGKLTALGCTKVTPLPGLRYSCPTYDAFRKCSAVYPSDSPSASENLCWIQRHTADPILAKEVLAELGPKRCGAAPQSLNVQCTRPWKQTMCVSLVAALSQGPPGKSAVSCLQRTDTSFIAARKEAQAIIKGMNTEPGGMGAVDPATGTTQGQVPVTQAACGTAPAGAWDPLRISCKDESARKELAATLGNCLLDPNKDGADAPCYDGPLINAPVNETAVGTAAVPFPDGDFSRIIDVEIDYYDSRGTEWVRADSPSVNGIVAVRCIYEHAPVRALNPDAAWTIGFLEGGRLLEQAVGPGPADAAGRVTRTWYGRLLAPGPIELGCARTVDEVPDGSKRLLRTVDVPSTRPARELRGPRIAAVTPRQAAAARGALPTLDVRFTHFAGIRRTDSDARVREAAVLTAAVGQPLIVDCGYVTSMDSPNGEPVVLDEWRAIIEQDGRPVQSVAGDNRLVSVRGVSTPGRLLHRFTPTEAGQVMFRCRLDIDDTIAETDENNNRLELGLTVTRLRQAPPATGRQ